LQLKEAVVIKKDSVNNMQVKNMPELLVKRVRTYNFLSLISYLHVRFKVFVIEDKRRIFGEFYLDDFKGKHYKFLLNKKVIGVVRVIDRGDFVEFGRIAIKKEYRKQGYGTKFINLLIKEVRNTEPTKPISLYIEKQSLTNFYQKFGFVENGKEYFDNIAYIKMRHN
jgi:predicted GNAT family N-acyltransferase